MTDLLINMVAKAARQDEGFLLDLAALQVRLGNCGPQRLQGRRGRKEGGAAGGGALERTRAGLQGLALGL